MPERFISLVAALLRAIREIEQGLNRDSGRLFNVFGNLWEPNEPTTSRILAFLLDANEAHGQGSVFAQASLSVLCLNGSQHLFLQDKKGNDI